MTYCTNCGNSLEQEDVKFCNSCGNKRTDTSNSSNSSIVQQQNTSKIGKFFQGVKKVAEFSAPHLKRAGEFVVERAKIVHDNFERDAKEKKGIFNFNWEPPEGVDPFKIDIPKEITMDSFGEISIFGRKPTKKERPYILKIQRIKLYQRDKGICQVCHNRVDKFYFVIAHNKAHSKGGHSNNSNLFIAHHECNSSMGTKSLKEMQKRMS